MSIAAPVFALAQTATDTTATNAMTAANTTPTSAATNSDQIQAVVVTARKRSEDALKIPVSVTAFSAAALEARDIQTLDDVSKFTPGMTDNQASFGSGRTDRSFQSIVIRGMNPSSTVIPTTSIFINGTPVGSSDMIQNLDDVDHVEVLKGPQSAYFGRETFAGAVNIVTKASSNTLTGNLSVEAGTRNTQIVSGDLSGPLIADKLMVSVGAKYNNIDGSYKNAANPSQTLGDQQTKSFHVGFTAKPIDNLTIKAFAMWLQDNDGPSASGEYLTSGAGAFTQSNCTVAGTPFLCGTLPKLSSASPAQNTTITPAVRKLLANPGDLTNKDSVQRFGLKRDASHVDLNINYDVPSFGLSLTYLSSYNEEKWSELSDLSNIDGAAGGQYPGYAGYPFMVQYADHDMSQEFRIATNPNKPYRALIGVSYVDTHQAEGLGSPFTGVGTTQLVQSETSGVFFSFAYDILQQLTLTFEGRFQNDREASYSVVSGAVQDEAHSYAFLPRASIQYRFTPDIMAYATYSKGVNPGIFNSAYANLPAASQAEVKAAGFNIGTTVQPEKLTNYEIGTKGRFFNGRATLTADIYYDKWENQIDANNFNFGVTDSGNPYNVVGSATYTPGNKSIYPFNFSDNSANSTAKGVEFEANVIPVRHVNFSLTGAYTSVKYDSYICTSCLPYTTFNAAGKYLPNAPLLSFATGLEYDNTFELRGYSIDWFARVDAIYKDGVWLDSSNTVKTPSRELVNIRGGFTLPKGFEVEGYVDNLFNNKAPVYGFQGYNFATNFGPTAVVVGLPQLITGGVRVKYHF
jgi:iron complex outermembrane receptor protein